MTLPFLKLILGQQLADIAAGKAPGSFVDPKILDGATRRALKRALRDVSQLPQLVLDVAAG